MKKGKIHKSRFVDIIVRARKEKNLGQKEVADALDMDTGAYGHIETGRTELSADVLDKACEFMGMQVLIVNKEALK